LSQPWAVVQPVTGQTPGQFTVSIDGSALADGTHQTLLTVTAAGVPGSPKTITVTVVVQPSGGVPCTADAWFCQPFDALQLGDLDGQGGWTVLPGDETGQVELDARGVGNTLSIDPPPGTFVKDIVTVPDHPIEGTEISMQVMTNGPPSTEKQVAKIEFYTVPGVAWGKTLRTFGALRFGSTLYLQYGANIYQTLVEVMEPGRWYGVTVRYQNGQIQAVVDGVLTFTTANPLSGTHPVQAFTTTGWDFPGVGNLDVIQARSVGGGGSGGTAILSVVPMSLTFWEFKACELTSTDPLAMTPRLAETTPSEPKAIDGRARVSASAGANDTTSSLRVPRPIVFEPNAGQMNPDVRFAHRSPSRSLYFTPRDVTLVTSASSSSVKPSTNAKDTTRPDRAVMRTRFRGANPAPVIRASNPLPGRSHYLVGRDRSRWRTNVDHFAKVEYQQLYPGIDLVFYGTDGLLEYDFVVAPGADPRRIELEFDGVDRLSVDRNGDLLLAGRGLDVVHRKPRVYQEIGGRRRIVEGRFVAKSATVAAFEIGDYDRGARLVVDPTLTYSTYFGGGRNDWAHSIATDAAGDVYIAGVTDSSDFPTVAPFQALLAEPLLYDAFVTKFSSDGSTVLFSTYLGGTGDEASSGTYVVPTNGGVLVAGSTASSDFPVLNPVQENLAGEYDGYITKLDASGSQVLFSTYLGGSDLESIQGLGADSGGEAVVTGTTQSSNFPTTPGAIQSNLSGSQDVFVTKLEAAGTDLVYSTYYGSSFWDQAVAMAVDGSGAAYVVGYTGSTNFPTTPDPLHGSPAIANDGFIFKLDPSGESAVYSTYLGGGKPYGVGVDGSGNVYYTGHTQFPGYPTTPNAAQGICSNNCLFGDAFVSSLDATGTEYRYSTFLGGSGDDHGVGITVESGGTAYVVGWTRSDDFPLGSPIQDLRLGDTFNGDRDGFVTEFSSTGVRGYSTYLGGNGDDVANAVARDGANNTVVLIGGGSDDFPMKDALQAQPFGLPQSDAIIAKINDAASPLGSGRLELGAANYAVVEGADQAVITVRRWDGTSGQVTVGYSTSDGTATELDDYEPVSGTRVFTDGQNAKQVGVPILNDTVAESDETFSLTLSNPTGGAILGSPATATVTIVATEGDFGSMLSRTFTVFDRNSPTGPSWVAVVDAGLPNAPWLTLDSYSGVGPSTITATVDTSGLEIGPHSATITISSPEAANGPQIIQVSLSFPARTGWGANDGSVRCATPAGVAGCSEQPYDGGKDEAAIEAAKPRCGPDVADASRIRSCSPAASRGPSGGAGRRVLPPRRHRQRPRGH
jgi:hypothetical protein